MELPITPVYRKEEDTFRCSGLKCSSSSRTLSLQGFRIEFAYQSGPYSLKLRGQFRVDLD